jgi:thiosulfate/3-mercaptopyruvate sulfurtransferase
MYTTLISVAGLRGLIEAGAPLAIYDCSFDLFDPAQGQRQYLEAHLPGARHIDLDAVLSAHGDAPRSSGGRHPLPTREAFARRMAEQGLHADTQVVVYDRQGVNFCGRLWWMLKWCGHDAVAVLNGGLAAWQAEGLPLERGPAPPVPRPGHFEPRPSLAPTVDAAGILARLGEPNLVLVDARAPARYRGETEPLDPVAGHIPGALNRPFGDNLTPEGRFKPAAQLRAEFEALLGGRDPGQTIHYCGSGVSAVPNVLAMAVAGWGMTRLFPGSWSEWCATPGAVFACG